MTHKVNKKKTAVQRSSIRERITFAGDSAVRDLLNLCEGSVNLGNDKQADMRTNKGTPFEVKDKTPNQTRICRGITLVIREKNMDFIIIPAIALLRQLNDKAGQHTSNVFECVNFDTKAKWVDIYRFSRNCDIQNEIEKAHGKSMRTPGFKAWIIGYNKRRDKFLAKERGIASRI